MTLFYRELLAHHRSVMLNSDVHLRYTYRLSPTTAQRAALARAFGCARVVYNDALMARRVARKEGRPYPSDSELSLRIITEAKKTPGRAWLGGVSVVVLQQALADLNRAYRNYLDSLAGRRAGRKMGAPRFRSRKGKRQSIRFTRNAKFTVTRGGRLRLPKIGDVRVRWSRDLPAEPSSVTVVRDAAGRFFASFVVEVSPRSLPDAVTEVGIDLGLTWFAVLSDGRKIAAPRYLRGAERRLKRLQRRLSRKQKGSNNRNKARIALARQHARVAETRRDFHHRLSSTIIRENQTVIVEDLAVSALMRTRLAKSIHDAGWSSFVGMLRYKAELHGRNFVQINRFQPTSQTCSACGVRDGPKPLNIRGWVCGGCGASHDRDHNAARNILAAGRAERKNASGGSVSPLSAVARPAE